MHELNSEAIDFRAASEFFALFQKLQPAELETLHLTGHQERRIPTVAGMLLIGRLMTESRTGSADFESR